LKALNGLYCADVPLSLRNYSLTHFIQQQILLVQEGRPACTMLFHHKITCGLPYPVSGVRAPARV